ncbi:hypothetical protein GGR08_001049 [Bartonella fuyuanensis]|uniref:Uncharacterized protein n=1 Tax=Bartonella fuyuanensis TaxID=1460968 RepID=A0A840DZ03_9HYPH|nr:hypothetical protein [Bartonella fuyuanensis]MBB4076742.1 hypothetical protein [Bartonella fuyuanensis]
MRILFNWGLEREFSITAWILRYCGAEEFLILFQCGEMQLYIQTDR